MFEAEPQASGYKDCCDSRDDEHLDLLPVVVQLLKIHSEDRCCKVQRHVHKGENGD